jgi:endonuclease/exonuclease/phosphatase family metal-dependent hydrolase
MPTTARNHHNVLTAENDNASRAFAEYVPKEYRDTAKFIDVLQWNIEWFGASKSESKDRQRFDRVVDILEAFNSDLFVFQEIAGPSKDGRYPGVMDAVAEELKRRGAGDYVVYYTEAGGEQRVAMMWDRDWLRAKSEVQDLFPRGTHQDPGHKDPFAGRTPLYGHFSARIPAGSSVKLPPGAEKFDFQVLGVHLKAMGDGAPQREESAEVLADWLKNTAPLSDSDTMIVGDWNAAPDAPEWWPIRALEGNPNTPVHFSKINDPSDYSYLWLANRSDKFMSRIDLAAITLASDDQIVDKKVAKVVQWTPIQDALAKAGSMTSKEVVNVLKEVKETISDHLPTLARFYIKQKK